MSRSHQDRFGKGRKAEERVARNLRMHGASVKLSPGSRTTVDLEARWPGGKRWMVQVKSGKCPRWPSTEELQGLNSKATKKRATPVVAMVREEGITYFSARCRRKLNL